MTVQNKYKKTETATAATYPEAVKLADKMYSEYGKLDSTGSRTCSEAKVRIKQRENKATGRESFDVSFYKAVETVNLENVPKKKGKKKKTKEKQELAMELGVVGLSTEDEDI